MTVSSYVRRGRRLLRQWAVNPRIHALAEAAGCALAGCLLSAASLTNRAMPLTLGLLCAAEGWSAVWIALGGSTGYLLFWGTAGLQGLLWMMGGLLALWLLGSRPVAKEQPALMPAAAGLVVSASGVIFLLRMGDTTPIPAYLLRVALGAGTTVLFTLVRRRSHPAADALAAGAAVLALSQVAPVPWLDLGVAAAGAMAAAGTFPAAALAGLAVDAAGIVPVSVTAVVSVAWLARCLPGKSPWRTALALAASACAMMAVTGRWNAAFLPALVLGGLLGGLAPAGVAAPRTGELGLAQVRLELTAGVLTQAEQLLLEAPEPVIDLQALVTRAANQACLSCPCRRSCGETAAVETMPPEVLSRALLTPEDLPVRCRKPGRVLMELRRSQEQFRALRAGHERTAECRWAVIQQYQFLGEYLRRLSDRLADRKAPGAPAYRAEVAGVSAGRGSADGDKCVWFAGPEDRYYVLLCDGMGTGPGAAQDSRDAVYLLHRLLAAGFPADSALRSLNSLCVLRQRSGAVTADLAELQLDTGKAVLYKWGAAPSYLLRGGGAEKIGTAGPPPGLSVRDGRETVERLSLRRGETLVLVSDGVDGEAVRRRAGAAAAQPVGETAAAIVKMGRGEGGDDATAVAVRLIPAAAST